MMNEDNYAIKCVIYHVIGLLYLVKHSNAECVSLSVIIIVVGASFALIVPALIIWLIHKKRAGEYLIFRQKTPKQLTKHLQMCV